MKAVRNCLHSNGLHKYGYQKFINMEDMLDWFSGNDWHDSKSNQPTHDSMHIDAMRIHPGKYVMLLQSSLITRQFTL
jgi:hypothetical protein